MHRAGTTEGTRAGAAWLVLVVLGFGCEGSRTASSTDTPRSRSQGESTVTAQPSTTSSPRPPAPQVPDAAASSTPRSDVDDEGSVVIEGTLVDDPKIGRPVPGVLIVTNDPRYIVPVRVQQVDPVDAEDFTVGESIRLGIHSPSRTFPGGVAKGMKVRLRIHWRRSVGGPRRYYHVQRDRAGQADR